MEKKTKMEPSFFNVYAGTINGNHILFNSLMGSLALLDETAWNEYSNNNATSETLISSGFLVPSAQEQANTLRTFFEEDRDQTDTLTLCILTTYHCNLECVYCYEPQNLNKPATFEDQTIEELLNFVSKIYKENPFKTLEIVWYGGEPTLYRSTLEKITKSLLSFAEDNKVVYKAEIITNATLIDENYAQFLHNDCKVEHAMPTVEGHKELHDFRRPNKNGSGSYDSVLQGAKALIKAGVDVTLSCNLEGSTFKELPYLQKLAYDMGANCSTCSLRDYKGTYGTGKFKHPEFELLDRDEYCKRVHEVFSKTPFTTEVLRDLLKPRKHGCRGYRENYFVIDPEGEVYKCEGYAGIKDKVLFNLADDINISNLNTATRNPFEHEKCATCKALPLCMGYCYWARDLFGDVCNTYGYTIADYAADYAKAAVSELENNLVFTKGVAILAKPFDLDTVLEEGRNTSYSYVGAYKYDK